MVQRTQALGRRQILGGAGAAGLLAPFLSLAHRRPAHAAAGSAKYLLIFHTTGTALDLWRPTGSSTDEIVFSEMLEPLAPLTEDLVVIDGLDSMGTANNHAAPGGLTGQGYSGNSRISLEQFVGDKLAEQGVSTPFGSLILGGVSSQSQSTFYRDNQVLSPLFLPSTAYGTIFAGLGGGEDGEAAELRLARRQSILDLARDQLDTLGGQLGAAERQKLELHTESSGQLEERLAAAGGGGACPQIGAAVDSVEELENSALHAELATTAFACDLTRVAAIEFGHHQATQVGLPELGPGDWHQFLHGGQMDKVVAIERWIGAQFVAAADRLKALPAPDGDGTLYDQTLMIWTRGMGDAIGHSGTDMRFVLAGGAGGYLDQTANGRYVSAEGEAHQRVLFNCCEAMGITDFTGFGSTEPDAGPREPIAAVGS
ncbi:MAG: DUF1552 domain-containing protein [Myxococcota bacterium]